MEISILYTYYDSMICLLYELRRLESNPPTDYAMPFWPCHAFLGGPACWTKFTKLVWIIAYSMQKELCKNIQPFSCNFLTKYWRGPATPL